MSQPTSGYYGTGPFDPTQGNAAQKGLGQGLYGSTTQQPWLPGVTPLIAQQPYGDYQNFGTIAQRYGAAGAGQLNTPAIQNALQGTEAGAAGQLGGQIQQDLATRNLAQAAAGNSASQNLLSNAAQGLTPSAAEIQQRQGVQQGVANAAAMGASTRGNFGLANAQRNAMAAEARGANEIAAGGAATRAGEMANARGQFAQAQGAAQGQYGQVASAQANNQLLGAQQNFGAQAQNQNTNLGYYTGQQGAYQNQSNSALNAAIAAGNQQLGQAGQATQQQIAQNQLTQNYVSGGMGALGGLMLMSDERTKEDVRPAGEIMSQLDHFNPVSFGYKAAHDTPNAQAADAPQVGVLAQDVERGPAGRMLVQHGPSGEKYLHVPSMVGVMAAGEGALKARGDDHEARLARLERLLRAA